MQISLKTSVAARLACMALLVMLIGGCVSAPEKPDKKVEGIYFVENKSIDLAVRKDFERALVLLQQEKYAEGIELLQNVIKGSQKVSAPHINIAIAYKKVGDVELAEKHLKQALEINPDHPVANNEYALLYRKTGRYLEARQLYERVLQKYPEFLPARKNLGILCDLYLNDAPCALDQYQRYSKANPDDGDVELWIAGLKQKLGN